MVNIICKDCGERKEKYRGFLCHECYKIQNASRMREYRRDNPEWREYHRGWARKWRNNSPNYGGYRKKENERNRIFRKDNADWRVLHKVNVANRRAKLKGNGGGFTRAEWRALCKKYGNKCLGCGEPGNQRTLTVDHVVPVSLGGSGDISNIQPLCKSCNCSKQDRIIDYR